jgi:hypothetical protein
MRKTTTSRLASLAALAGVVGLALAPVSVSAVTATANTTINANLGSTISITTSGTVTLNITPVSGGSQSSASDTVTVNTNNATGYNLAVADATLTLTNGANTIAASSNTFAAATTLANNTWGWAVANTTTGIGSNGFDASYSAFTNQSSHASHWAGITASDQQFKSTSTTATNDTTTVWYSAKADTTKPNGTYTDTVVYTATTNP